MSFRYRFVFILRPNADGVCSFCIFGTVNVFSQERFLGLKLKINKKKAQSFFKPNTWVAVLFFE